MTRCTFCGLPTSELTEIRAPRQAVLKLCRPCVDQFCLDRVAIAGVVR